LDSKQADKSSRDGATPIGAKLTALARRAEAVIVFERFWPPLVWAATLVALFRVVLARPVAGAAARGANGGVAAFAIGFIVALAPLARLRRPVRTETLDAPRPRFRRAASPRRFARRPTRHGRRRSCHRLLCGPAPRAPGRQVERSSPPRLLRACHGAIRARLRFAVLLAAIAAALVAGPERYGRIAAAFDWRNGAAAAATARLDAWIDPPPYANKPPILLDLAANRDPSQKIVTPEGSALVVRADAGAFETQVEGAIAPVAAVSQPIRPPRPLPPPRRADREALDDCRRRRGCVPPRRRHARRYESKRRRSTRRPSRCSSRRAAISAVR